MSIQAYNGSYTFNILMMAVHHDTRPVITGTGHMDTAWSAGDEERT